MVDRNFKLNFLLENTNFFNEDESKPLLLGFKLVFTINVKEDYTMEGDVLLHFHPKTKEFILSEFSLGKGFNYSKLSVEDLFDNSNKCKVHIKEPNSERKYVFMSIWKQSGTEFDQQKIDAYKKWWTENYFFLKEYIINNKQLYNDIIINQIDEILID